MYTIINVVYILLYNVHYNKRPSSDINVFGQTNNLVLTAR